MTVPAPHPAFITIRSPDDLSLLWSKLKPGSVDSFRQYAIIVRPDTVVGTNMAGELVDPVPGLAIILTNILQFKVIILDMSTINLDSLEHELKLLKITQPLVASIGRLSHTVSLLRMASLLVFEGGRQSIYDPASFGQSSGDSLSHDQFLCLLSEYSRVRALAGSAPAIYICLSHQGIVAALTNNLLKTIELRDEIEQSLHACVGLTLSKEFKETIAIIDEKGRAIRVTNDNGDEIAYGIQHAQFTVHPNEMVELGNVVLIPYHPSGHASSHLPEFLIAHRRTAIRYSGLIEELIATGQVQVSMLHGDEVEESAVLYLNWAFQMLWAISVRIVEKLAEAGNFYSASNIIPSVVSSLLTLPVGIEITSSTAYSLDSRDQQGNSPKTLTNVASLAIYYYDYVHRTIKRDLSFQFHPEIRPHLQLLDDHSFRQLRVSEIDDGIKILITSVMTGNATLGYA